MIYRTIIEAEDSEGDCSLYLIGYDAPNNMTESKFVELCDSLDIIGDNASDVFAELSNYLEFCTMLSVTPLEELEPCDH